MNTLPTIHMNGTSAKMLLEGYEALKWALLEAAQAFGKCELNARDYYPQGPDAWGKVRDEWSDMQATIQGVREKVNALILHIHDQSRQPDDLAPPFGPDHPFEISRDQVGL